MIRRGQPRALMGKKHALIIPVCLQAHFVGLYRHAVQLAKRGVTITFVGLEREIALLKTFEELDGLDFNLVSYQDYGSENFAPVGDVLLDILEFVRTSKARFQPILDKLVADKRAGLPDGPTCIIGDRFSIWAIDAAKELDVPYFQFWSCGATFVRALQAQVLLMDDNTLTMKEVQGGFLDLEPFEGHLNIQGLPPLEYRDMMKCPLVDFKEVAAANDRGIGLNVNKADGLIVNTFYDLEAPQIEAIQQSWKDYALAKTPRLYLVGPISNAATFKDRSLVDLKSSGDESLRWLDGRPPLSVVYICLGSLACLLPTQVEGLALALESSEQSFVWVVARGVADLIPPGFEARTKERGLVVNGWVPQLQILHHSAVGGFVTHCGWNSIIESITAGVPMAAWPQVPNDQFINARHLVDVLKVAVEVRIENTTAMSASTSPKKYVNLEKAVRLLLSEEGNALRTRVQELQKKAEAAVANGGASEKALNDVVESIPSD